MRMAKRQAREWAGDDERRRKAEYGGVGALHSRGAPGTVLGIGVSEVGSFVWCSRARRLVGSAMTRRLGGPSAHRPSGRDPETGAMPQRAIGPQQNPAGGTFVWLF